MTLASARGPVYNAFIGAPPRPGTRLVGITPYDYLDFRRFLRDWFKDRNGRPSMRSVATELGCSVAQLSRVVNATRDLSAPHAEALSVRLGVSEAEREYFLDMVAYEQNPTLATRRDALDRLMAVRRHREARRLSVSDHTYALLSRWYYGAIMELARCAGFREDHAWIGKRLVPNITEEEVAESIEALLDLGALGRIEGRLVAVDGMWATDHVELDHMVSLALSHRHRTMMDRAKYSLDVVGPNERHFAGTTLAVDDALMAEIKQRIAQFYMEINNLVAKSERPPTRVVQLGTQLFPLSREDDDDDEDH